MDMYLWACEEVILGGGPLPGPFGRILSGNLLLLFFFSSLFYFPQEMSFSRSISLTRPGSSSLSGGPNSILCRGRAPGEERKTLCKAPSLTSSWQPWTPVPQAREKLLPTEETAEDSLFTPRLGESSTSGVLPSSRIRHRSEPQHPKEKPFVFNLDDENIRTSDV